MSTRSWHPRPLALLLLCSFAATSAAEVCETPVVDPATGEQATLSVAIDRPASDATVVAFDDGDACRLRVAGRAAAVAASAFDFYLVIDASGSTAGGAGADVDGDGIVSSHDSVLRAEVEAARLLVDSVDLRTTRLAILAFSSDAAVKAELTGDGDALRLALDGILADGPLHLTNYAEALRVALDEHARTRDPSRRQVLLFLSDGDPTTSSPSPFAGDCTGYDDDECSSILWAEEAGLRGVAVETFAVGQGADPEILAEMSRRSGGGAHVATIAADIVDLLPHVSHAGVASLSIRHLGTGEARDVDPGPDGSFSAELTAVAGRNDVEVVATSTSGATLSCRVSAEVRCISHGCPADVQVPCDGPGGAEVTGLVAWASDGSIDVTSDSPFDQSEPPGDGDASGRYPPGVTEIHFLLSHPEAGERSCTVRVTVVDGGSLGFVDPPADVTASCAAVPPLPAVEVRGGCGEPPIPRLVETRMAGPCPGTFELVRTWTAEDATGRRAEHVQRVSVVDDVAPVLRGVPEDAVISCEEAIPRAMPTAEDQCDPQAAVRVAESERPGRCPAERTIARTFVAEDACGNLAEASQVIEVVDVSPPRLVGVPEDATVECDEVPAPAVVTAEDGCDDAPVVRLSEERIPGPCPSRYALVRTWTAEDGCGNAAIAAQRIEVLDRRPPVIAPRMDDVACAWSPSHGLVEVAAAPFAPQVSDACDDAPSWLIASCVSSQPADAKGDGDTEEDCVIAPDGRSLLVRVERSGGDKSGRRYLVSAVATDACGNSSAPTPVGSVFVPHDASRAPEGCAGGR